MESSTMREQCTRIDTKYSSGIDCSVGVPQGPGLGPYLVYISMTSQLSVLKFKFTCVPMI